MKTIVYGLTAVVLAALSAGCAYTERTQAVAAPGAEYYVIVLVGLGAWLLRGRARSTRR